MKRPKIENETAKKEKKETTKNSLFLYPLNQPLIIY